MSEITGDLALATSTVNQMLNAGKPQEEMHVVAVIACKYTASKEGGVDIALEFACNCTIDESFLQMLDVARNLVARRLAEASIGPPIETGNMRH